jgi:hypothetical protein
MAELLINGKGVSIDAPAEMPLLRAVKTCQPARDSKRYIAFLII